MNIKDYKIGTRLGFAFFIVILFTIFSSAAGLKSLISIGDKWTEFSNVSMEKRRLASNGSTQLGNAVHHFKDYVLRGGEYEKKFDDDIAKIVDDVAAYRNVGELTAQEKSALDQVLQGCDQYSKAMRKAVELKAAGKTIEEVDKSIAGADKEIATAWEDILSIARQDASAAGKVVGDTVSSSQRTTFILSGLVVALSVLCAFLVTRSIVKPIGRAVRAAEMIASGDLTNDIEVTSQDETGQLLQAMKTMTANLQQIVSQVRTGTETIAAASEQIASGNLDLSTRTEEQAASLEETASSMEELTTTVKHNADNSSHANRLAMVASEVAMKGGAVVSNVVNTMGEINESSRKITDIVGVIDGIAFQTNILALNAAVEAARAGEQGRGFAVVATEVRNLAQRSAVAAKEIRALIVESVEKVDAGTRYVNQAGGTMDEVVDSVKRVNKVIDDMTAANREQSAGIEQINQAVAQMDEVTQQNAALVEEAAAAANSLRDQANQLLATVQIFKLPTNGKSISLRANHEPRPSQRNAIVTPISAAKKRDTLPLRAKRIANAPLGDEWETF